MTSLSRRNPYKMPISIREWLVCICSILTLIFTAWSFGGYENWALHLLLIGGLGTFLASLMPMPKSWNGYDQQHGNLKNFKRLLAQPFFWASLCFLGYILIQHFNPSMVQVFGEKSWWVEPMKPPLGENLPSSVKADYDKMNALRAFNIQASAISLACGILVGIQRRKTALLIVWSFLLSGASMAFVAILQKLYGTNKILWLVDVANQNPWGTFAYRNQAAAFLILVLIISGLLYFSYIRSVAGKLKQDGPQLLLILIIFLLQGSIWLSLSRGGIILSLLTLFAFLILALTSTSLSHSKYNVKKGLTRFLILGVLSCLFVSILSDWEEMEKRWNHFQKITFDLKNYDRALSTKATFEMSQDRLIFGWGGGSFRYIFPIYQRDYNSLWHYSYHPTGGWYGRRFYSYAHNDLVQFLAEYGILGSIFLAAMFGCLLPIILNLSSLCWRSGLFFFIGLLAIIVHNFVDFIFSSPSYWCAFWATCFLLPKLIKTDNLAN